MVPARYADSTLTPEGSVGPDGQQPIVTILGLLPPTRSFHCGCKYHFDVCFQCIDKAIQEMKYYQKHSEGLLIAKRAFLHLVRQIADENCREDYRDLAGSVTVYMMNSEGFSG